MFTSCFWCFRCKKKEKNMANWELVSNICSGITLFLFVVYIIGRGMTIWSQRDLYFDKIEVKPSASDLRGYEIIERVYLKNPINNVAIITSKEGIRDLKIIEYKYDKGYNEVIETKVIKQYQILKVGQSVAIYFDMPEIFPHYRIEYRTGDYRKVEFDLWVNMKNGVVSETVYPRHTCKSVLY